MYSKSAQELWSELTERIGESNGHLLFQLEKGIGDLRQGEDSVAVYCTKLKKLWDELSDLSEIPECLCADTCKAMKKTRELEDRQKLMKFLIHLDDDYDSIRGQILLMDPLPTVNKAYSMIQRIEREKQITGCNYVTREVAANASRFGSNDCSSQDSSNALPAKNGQRGRKDFR